MVSIAFLSDGPADASTTLILAHGAGGAMDAEFMNVVCAGIAAAGVHVLRFEFPYMAQRRATGKKRPPDREPILLDTWREVVRSVESDRLFIGGKSMGGRMASMVADELEVAGLTASGTHFTRRASPRSYARCTSRAFARAPSSCRARTTHLAPARILPATR